MHREAGNEVVITHGEQFVRPSQRPQGQGRRRQDQHIVCYRCGKEGHYARGCTAARNPGGSNTGGNTQQTEPYMHPLANQFSINNVSNYLLPCSMYNVPVSFLINTGAGVSLLQGNVWDKIRSKDHKLTTVTLQRLVGADGIPIRIRGSTLIQFSTGSMEFKHEFVIADHITAEAILGLDFLEANKCMLDLSKQEMTNQNKVLELQPSPANAIVQQQCATVTVMNTIVEQPNSEMEVIAHVNTQGNGTWLLESIEYPVLVAKSLGNTQTRDSPSTNY